jgi:hypothetical protein
MAGREIRDGQVGRPRQTDRIEGGGGRQPGAAEQSRRETEVFQRGERALETIAVRQEMQALGQAALAETCGTDRPGLRSQQAGERRQQRRFAGAVAPGHGERVARRQRERHTLEDAPPGPAASEGVDSEIHRARLAALPARWKGRGGPKAAAAAPHLLQACARAMRARPRACSRRP